MPIVKLKRGSDVWLLVVGDEHADPDSPHTNLNIEEKALQVANGDEATGLMPGNGDAGWKVVSTHDDYELEQLREELEAS